MRSQKVVDDMESSRTPTENCVLFCLFYEIETALRELIIEELEKVGGPTWYKAHLPGDIYEKYKRGLQYEKAISWSNMIPYHPIYYIDFADLRKIIENATNWKDVFLSIF